MLLVVLCGKGASFLKIPGVALLLALCFTGVVHAATNSYLFSYPDRASFLADGWSFLGLQTNGLPRNTETTNGTSPPDVSYDQVEHPGTLRIPVANPGDLYYANNSTRNTLFRNLSSNWLTVQLELAFQPTENYQQVNLSVYQDDDNFIGASFGYAGGQAVSLNRETNRVPTTIAYSLVNASNWPSLHLRLERDIYRGDISGSYSSNGSNWIAIGRTPQTFGETRLAIWSGGKYGTSNIPMLDLRRLDVVTSDTNLITQLVIQPTELAFNTVAGQSCTNVQVARLINRGPQPLNWTVSSTAPWLFVSPTNGPANGVQSSTCDVWVDSTGLTNGHYQGSLLFAAPAAGNSPVSLNVNLIVNPAGKAKVAVWRGGKAAAMSVSVDDGQPVMFSTLTNYGFSGTYVMNGTSAPSFFNNYYLKGMELGPHLVAHTCSPYDEPGMRYQMGANIDGLNATTTQPPNDVLTLIYPCGFFNTRMQVIASDYVLCARGYGINLLEDQTPYDLMNIKSFNSHGTNTDTGTDLNPTPTNFLPVVNTAIAQGKWVNLVFHGASDDDGAVAYASTNNIWVHNIGKVAKYILQRDRTILSNYVETSGLITFDCYRLSIPPSPLRDWEATIGPLDPVTLQIDVSGISVSELSVNGVVTTNFSILTNGVSRLLVFNAQLTGTPQPVRLTFSTNRPPLTPPTLIAPVVSNETFSVSLATVTGHVYYLEYQEVSTWTTVDTFTGDGAVHKLTDPAASSQRRFYRVRVE